MLISLSKAPRFSEWHSLHDMIRKLKVLEEAQNYPHVLESKQLYTGLRIKRLEDALAVIKIVEAEPRPLTNLQSYVLDAAQASAAENRAWLLEWLYPSSSRKIS